MASLILLDPSLRQALAPLAHKAPNGYASVGRLADDVLLRILTWPDEVKGVTADNHLIDLPEVDVEGYTVYDRTFTAIHTIQYDINNPLQDLVANPDLLRTMQFGASGYDFEFMLRALPGDVFYIGWSCGVKPPRVLMVVVFDPLVT